MEIFQLKGYLRQSKMVENLRKIYNYLRVYTFFHLTCGWLGGGNLLE